MEAAISCSIRFDVGKNVNILQILSMWEGALLGYWKQRHNHVGDTLGLVGHVMTQL